MYSCCSDRTRYIILSTTQITLGYFDSLLLQTKYIQRRGEINVQLVHLTHFFFYHIHIHGNMQARTHTYSRTHTHRPTNIRILIPTRTHVCAIFLFVATKVINSQSKSYNYASVGYVLGLSQHGYCS